MAEFGDFQTPLELARRICALCRQVSPLPRSVVEPTCGQGSFLVAAADVFPECRDFVGRDVDPLHIQAARRAAGAIRSMDLEAGNFFLIDWDFELERLPQPILVLGNPPWVTNAELGSLRSKNVPPKSNRRQQRGIEALTGKSNFDISEWMLTRLLDALDGKHATLAMLCKSAVARKVLLQAWKDGRQIGSANCYRIDARRDFQVAVDASLLVCRLVPGKKATDSRVFESLDSDSAGRRFGYRDGRLYADLDGYDRLRQLRDGFAAYRWRSGVKHDCCRVMELDKVEDGYQNGLGETVVLEDDFLYPMRKSSAVSGGVSAPDRWMLVPQRSVGEPTGQIEMRAPRTWKYLVEHAGRLNRRRSSIYRNRPPFSVFGVGPYTFAPWKVAISGFYKRLSFSVLGPAEGKPTVLDDTCYFLACESREEAEMLARLLGSGKAIEYLSSLIFWDAKRPITAAILQELNVLELAASEGVDLAEHVARNKYCLRECGTGF